MKKKKKASNLLLRVITALIGGAAFLGFLIYGDVRGALFVTAVICFGALYEFSQMVFDGLESGFFFLLGILFFGWINFFPEQRFLLGFTCSFGLAAIFFTLRASQKSDLNLYFREFSLAVLGLIYLVLFPSYLPKIRALPQGLSWVLLFFTVIWLTDVGAYFSGRAFGKHKLYQSISGKKTWEGAVGGVLLAMVGVVIFYRSFFYEANWIRVFVMMILISCLSQVGDLLESFLKRAHDVKDSGTLLPGHGGFLDRFDSVIFTLPIYYYLIVEFV